MSIDLATAGEATRIEQARVIAEVQARIITAQRIPRSLPMVLAEMRESCRSLPLAEKAFYRYPRGGENVTGPSIHLARELARCYRHVDFGIAELDRRDAIPADGDNPTIEGRSEMVAWALDLELNVRSSSTFLVPHARDKKAGRVPLLDLRDVYENNANQGARRVREAIFAILPPAMLDEAIDLCRATLVDGGGRSLAQRVADAVAAFDGTGITLDRLEARVGAKVGVWTAHDIADLSTIYQSLKRGEIDIDTEFPDRRISAADLIITPSPEGTPDAST